MAFKRVSIMALYSGDAADLEIESVERWLKRCGDKVRVERHWGNEDGEYWDIEASPEALTDIPEDLCHSTSWSHPERLQRRPSARPGRRRK